MDPKRGNYLSALAQFTKIVPFRFPVMSRIHVIYVIIQALELGYEIKGRVSSLEIFRQCDSGRPVVKGKITWGLVPDSDS